MGKSYQLNDSKISIIGRGVNQLNVGKAGELNEVPDLVEGDAEENSEEEDSEDEYDDVWVCDYCDKEFMDEQKCTYHEKYCKYKNVYESDSCDNCCFRCGRQGHFASSCYASKHINGYYLNN